MASITSASTLTPNQQMRLDRLMEVRGYKTKSSADHPSPQPTQPQAVKYLEEQKIKKAKKEPTQSLSKGAKVVAAASAALVCLAAFSNPAATSSSSSLAFQPCPYPQIPNALSIYPLAPLYADCYPEQSLLLGRLTEEQIDALINRAAYPEEWAGGFIDRVCDKLKTTAQNVTETVKKLPSVICNALRLGAAEGEWPRRLNPPDGAGWAPLRFFLQSKQARHETPQLHPSTLEQLQQSGLPKPVADQFLKELDAQCNLDRNPASGGKVCHSFTAHIQQMTKEGTASIGTSVRASYNDPSFTVRTETSFGSNDSENILTADSEVRKTHYYENCNSNPNDATIQNDPACRNRNPEHEHDKFDATCKINPEEKSVECDIPKLHHAIGHKLSYHVFEKVITPICSMMTETLTLVGKTITNVTYAANPQTSKPFILSQIVQRSVFEPLRNMTVQADDAIKQFFRKKYPHITISPKLPSGLPQTCEELTKT